MAFAVDSYGEMRLSAKRRADAEAVSRFAELVAPVMAQRTPESVRRQAAEALALSLPYDSFDLRSANDERRELVPVFCRGPRAAQVMRGGDVLYGCGLSGWVASRREALIANAAHLDARALLIPGTPSIPQAVIGVPLVSGGRLKDVLVVRRDGAYTPFSDDEFVLARSFADLIAVALDNADVRAMLEQQANTDPLTGLPNRRRFAEELAEHTSAADHDGLRLSVLFIDVDGLKLANDMLGHDEGDRLLVTVAQTLTTELREGDRPARLAGDEFAALLLNTDSGEAEAIAARLERAITKVAQETTGIQSVGVSVGWAEFGVDGRDPEELLVVADRSMYIAKRRHHRHPHRVGDG